MSKLIVVGKSEGHWLPSTDLMSGLMLVFMLIAISFMLSASKERDEMKEVAKEWAITKNKIYNALNDEFKSDLEKWKATISRDSLLVRFREPDVLFEIGSSELTVFFKEIIDDFFPRYLNILIQFRESISEVRIEGHTSSEWNEMISKRDAYFHNMELSQDRTRQVLQYGLKQIPADSIYNWGEKMIIAAGMSSSRTVVIDSIERPELSRRVEFRVRTNADEKLILILESALSDTTKPKKHTLK